MNALQNSLNITSLARFREIGTNALAVVMVLQEIEDGNIGREHETYVRAALWELFGVTYEKEFNDRVKSLKVSIIRADLRLAITNKERFYGEVLAFAKPFAEKRRARFA